MDQPLDFSVKSPSSPGGESYCSHSSSKKRMNGSMIKDEQYWLRREKNNAAAKRSRDARRQKEEATKLENQMLKEQIDKLRYERDLYKEHVIHCKAQFPEPLTHARR